MQSVRIKVTTLLWFEWVRELIAILSPYLPGLILRLLYDVAIRVNRSRNRIRSTIFGDLVLSLIFSSCAALASTEFLAYLIRPLFQDLVTWLLASMTMLMIVWFAAVWSAISLWARECRRQTISSARKAMGYE